MTSKWCGKCGGEIVEGFCSTCHYNYTKWEGMKYPYLPTFTELVPDKLESEGGYEPYWL